MQRRFFPAVAQSVLLIETNPGVNRINTFGSVLTKLTRDGYLHADYATNLGRG